MFKLDKFNRPTPLGIYLCKPNREIICELNAIDENNASLVINMNNQYELSFGYNRYITNDNGELIESNGYSDLNVGMVLYVEGVGFFKMKYPPMKYDGQQESKSITASSIECELESKDLVDFKINTGEESSLENLVTYDSDETENIKDPYRDLPYDYIVFNNTFAEQLKEIGDKYSSNSTITDADGIKEIQNICMLIPRLKNKVIENEGKTSVEEYVTYTYNDANILTEIKLSDKFNQRVNELIVFYKKYKKQLSLIDLAIEQCECNWSVGKISKELANKKFQFDVSGQNIYSFLTNDVASAAECIFTFDIINKKINATLVSELGEDSKLIIDKENLINTLEISCSEDSIYTRYNVSGGNNIDIKYVNFGRTRIDDLSYFLNAKDESGKRIFMSDELANKYKTFEADREIARKKYIELTKQYNQYNIDLDKLKYRVPNDCVQNDWDTFSDKELTGELNAYQKLLTTLKTLYKEDYGAEGLNSDGSIKDGGLSKAIDKEDMSLYSPLDNNFIIKTIYWWDYYAYLEAIKQIKCTMEARKKDSTYKDIDVDATIKTLNAYKTEWSLYGSVELENKIKAYSNSLNVLLDSETVIPIESHTSENWKKLTDEQRLAYGNIEKYYTQEIKTWEQLSPEEKAKFSNLDSNYKYKEYIEIYNNSLNCRKYLNSLNEKIKEIEDIQPKIQDERMSLSTLTTLSGYNREKLNKIVSIAIDDKFNSFSEKEVSDLLLLYIDTNYSNENILTTSLDNTVSEIDIQKELLDDAVEQLSIAAQPQFQFSTEMDNLLCIPEFKDFNFEVGNYVTLEYYDNYYVKLRLNSITVNPCAPETSLSVTFTNYVTSKSKRTDLTYILGKATSYGSGSKGSSGGGTSSDSFGTSDKIDVTLSNTMLAKLLNTEMFGSRVSDIILDTLNVNDITGKFAKFESLANGSTIIDGSCLQTGDIFSKNYNGTETRNSNGVVIKRDIDNTKGSIIKLEDGTFNFGGGKFTLSNTKNGTELKIGESFVFDGKKLKIGTNNPFVIGDNGFDGLYKDAKREYNSDSGIVELLSGSVEIEKSKIETEGYISGLATDNLINTVSVSAPITNESDKDSVEDPEFTSVNIHIEYNTVQIEDTTTTQTTTEDTTTTQTTTISNIKDIQLKAEDIENLFEKEYTKNVDNNTLTLFLNYKLVRNKVLKSVVNSILADLADIDGSVSTFTITSLSMQISSKIIFTNYSIYSHIGTDYFKYGNEFSIKSGIVEIGQANIGQTNIGQTNIRNKLVTNGEIIMGESTLSGVERRISFTTDAEDGGHSHDVYIYGGNSKSKTSLGCYDKKNQCAIWQYIGNDDNGVVGSLYIKAKTFRFVDYEGYQRTPVASATDEKYRVSHVESRANQFYIVGTWGSPGKWEYRAINVPSSDIRLKENVKDCEVKSALSTINKIKLHSFDWKDKELAHQSIGFIADELEKIDPKFAIGGGYANNGEMIAKSVNDFYLMGYIVKSIQELYKMIKNKE